MHSLASVSRRSSVALLHMNPAARLLAASHGARHYSSLLLSSRRACAVSLVARHQARIPWRRGAKRKSTMKVEDLPQGALALAPFPSDNEPSYPTVIQQARNNMRRFTNCILLTRVGGFYEIYLEQADEIGPLLNLKVAQKRTSAGYVSMAGFPFYQLDRFLKILVQDHSRFVAISEEYPNLDNKVVGGLMFDRRVSRIITPGTLIDEKFMNLYENNFLLAISAGGPRDPNDISKQEMGLAWLDLSTGDFFTQLSKMGSLSGDVARIGPREVVLNELLDEIDKAHISRILEGERLFITFHPTEKVSNPRKKWEQMLHGPISKDTMNKMSKFEIDAGNLLLGYVQGRLPGMSMKLQPPIRRNVHETMLIDSNSMRGLEIKSTLRNRTFRGSLLHTVKRTVTESGTRLLANWLTSPVTSVSVIDSRLNLDEIFLHNLPLRERTIRLLQKTHDSQRIVQKFALGRGDADDLIALGRTIEANQTILEDLSSDSVADPHGSLKAILARLDIPLDLAKNISSAIDEEGLMQQQRIYDSEVAEMANMTQRPTLPLADQNVEYAEETNVTIKPKVRGKGRRLMKEKEWERQEAWIMQKSASRALKKAHANLEKLMLKKNELEEEIKVELDVPTLTLRWTPGLGYICHVKGRDINPTHEPLQDTIFVSSSRSTKSFHHPEWTLLGSTIDQARLLIRAGEQKLFQELREEVIRNLVQLRENAAVLDELDVACSFAVLAEEKRLVRPILNMGVTHKILGGRHPMVEAGLREHGRSFISNDCFVGDAERLWIITGPNMAGKSTFLRQNALISIMAQIGSFVPADHAEIGIVDQIFSRVGSADNLFSDQSTFMVEMLETAQILKTATPRSFVIMDEVGRGTTPIDGVAVAYACIHHLNTKSQCRTLFATHFHELADMVSEAGLESVGCYCTDIQEDHVDGAFSYIHRLREGVNRKSHALKVARLAGIPETTISIAKEALEKLWAARKETYNGDALPPPPPRAPPPSLPSPPPPSASSSSSAAAAAAAAS